MAPQYQSCSYFWGSYCAPCLEGSRINKPAPELLWHLSWGCWWWRRAEIPAWRRRKGEKFMRYLQLKNIRIVYPLEEREEGISKIANGKNLSLLPGEAGSSYTQDVLDLLHFPAVLWIFWPRDFTFLRFFLWHPVSSTSGFRMIGPTMLCDLFPLSIIECSHSPEAWAPSQPAKPAN